MTVGEKIQIYRKQLKMSQDELGQKLLVSRQTVSLWEKDQTMPTVDNLIRLKEIFGVSVDDILCFENKEQPAENIPCEIYRFDFSKDELKPIQLLQMESVYRKPIIFALVCVCLIIFSIGTSAPDIIVAFASGVLFTGAVYHIKNILAYKKAWNKAFEKICRSAYEYKIFENYLTVSIYRENEKMREVKCYYTDIEKTQLLGNWLTVQIGGQLFIVRKNELKENSTLFSHIPSATALPTNGKLKFISNLLFAASLLSIFGALAAESALSNANGLFTENMWVFFLFTPFPIASVIFGFISKKKDLKHQKNIIAGIIMTALLCVYGCFAFIF